jgi:hypothetical protein
MRDEDAEERKTARHEAAHAVAALHYDCGLAFASIERGPGSLGTTRLGVSRAYHVIPLFCGPLAEREWSDFDVQPHHPGLVLYGGDRDQFGYLSDGFPGDPNGLQPEAWWFLGQKEVQQQIDRVAEALLDQRRLTLEQVVEISGFTTRLCSTNWL